jgi:hypothetical protein
LRAWARGRWFWLSLAAIAVFALAIRLYGIGDALGHVDAGMDQRRLARSVLDYFQTGEIGHSTVEHYPGIHFWFLSGGFLFTYLWGLMSEVGMRFVRMPVEYFIYTGNIISALQGAILILLTGMLGRRIAGPRVGLVAAGLLAISPLSIDLSMQLRNDPAQVMLIVAAVLVALETYESGKGWQALVAGALAGLATGVKYSSLFVVLPVLLGAATSKQKDRRPQLAAIATASFGLALAASNHFIWADLPNFLRQLSVQIGITSEEHWAAKANPAAFHVSILARRVVGWPLMIAATALAAYRLGSGRWRWWLFLSFPLAYTWFTAQRPAQFARWVYPSAPFVAIAASAALIVVVGFLADRLFGSDAGSRAPRLAFGVVLSVLLASPIVWGFAHQTSRRLAIPTYTLIETWLREQDPERNRVLVERGWLALHRKRFEVERVSNLGELLDDGPSQLGEHDWIVVHEPNLRHPTLAGLELVERFTSDNSFGGSLGPDFAVYRTPATR